MDVLLKLMKSGADCGFKVLNRNSKKIKKKLISIKEINFLY